VPGKLGVNLAEPFCKLISALTQIEFVTTDKHTYKYQEGNVDM